ncbi:MAG TPA: Rrf2 family transcriptional regulator [Acidobacteriaceae bacterium]
MAANTRFSTGVHALVLLALQPETLQTSETIAGKLGTNPVVIRRVFALLQQAELVVSHKGPSGGTQLTRSAREITLKEIHRALEPGPLFHAVSIKGMAGEAVTKELARAFKRAEAGLLEGLAETTLHSVAKRAARRKA